MIGLSDIHVAFRNGEKVLRAVDGVSLSVPKGSIYGIVGRSGAGKSTLLRTINRLERPDSGAVRIAGEEITGYDARRIRGVRQGIGMIFQHFNLVHTKTVFDNVALALHAAGKGRAEIDAKVPELLERVGLRDKSGAYPSQLSGGQKQRVGIARGIANSPGILLCDEPTSALDLETTESILELLKTIQRRSGLTVVLISHEMSVIKRICDRVAVMKDGRIVEDGGVYDIFAHPSHPVTRELVDRTLNFTLPESVAANAGGTVLRVVFRGDEAGSPILAEASRRFDLNLNVLHGKIEYFDDRPLGILVVAVEGGDGKPEAKDGAIAFLREHTAEVEALHGA